MTALGGTIFYPALSQIALSNNLAIDAAGEKVAAVCRAPKSGTIDRVVFTVHTPVTSSQTLRVGLETLDASGDPSGSQYGGSAVGTQAAPAANTSYEVTLATPATATVGDAFAVVIQFDSAVGNLIIRGDIGLPVFMNGNYTDHFTASWAKSSNILANIVVRYSDGTYASIRHQVPLVSTINTFNSGSTPDERASLITIPVGFTAVGMWAYVDVDAACDLVLYDTDGTTALETVALSATARQQNANLWTIAPFASRSLTSGGAYRVALKPGASSISVTTGALFSAAMREAMSGETNIQGSTRTNAGAWTDSATLFVPCGLIVSAITSGCGGGASILRIP